MWTVDLTAPSRIPAASVNARYQEPSPPNLLGERAYQIIEAMIVSQELAPGSVVSETALAEYLGIGRTPVREGMQRLAREKLVTIMPRRGIRVTEINVADHLKLLEARAVLELAVARAAARRATDFQRQAMQELAAAIEQAGMDNDEERYLDLSRDLNTLPVAAADNEYLQAALELMYGLVRRFWFAHYRRNASLADAGRLHAARLRAIASGDAEGAEEATRSLNRYFEAFARSTIENLMQEHH